MNQPRGLFIILEIEEIASFGGLIMVNRSICIWLAMLLLSCSSLAVALPAPKIYLPFEGTDSGGWYDKLDAAWMNRAPDYPGVAWYPERPFVVWGGAGQPAPIIAEGGGVNGGDCLDATAISGMGTPGGVLTYGKIDNTADAWFANTPAEKAFDHALSFTITGWFNTKDPAVSISDYTNKPRLIHKYGQVSLLGETGGRLNLFLKKPGNAQQMVSDYHMYEQKNTWVFFAVTYDGSVATNDNNVRFYVGTEATEIISAGSRSTGANYGPLDWNVGLYLMIGNYGIGSVHGTAAFKGYLDDIRVFSSYSDASGALSVDDIEAIRRKDIGMGDPTYLEGDVNQDFRVDMDDLEILSSQWLD